MWHKPYWYFSRHIGRTNNMVFVDNATGGVFPAKRIAIGPRASIVNSIRYSRIYAWRYCLFDMYWIHVQEEVLCLWWNIAFLSMLWHLVQDIFVQTIVYVHLVLVRILDCYNHVLMREIYVSNIYYDNSISSSLHVTSELHWQQISPQTNTHCAAFQLQD